MDVGSCTRVCVLLALAAPVVGQDDTVRIEVGSPLLDARVYGPHAARVRVVVGDAEQPRAIWTNELTLGDSAGRLVMRWVTRGTQLANGQTTGTWELWQTYDAITMAPLGYAQSNSQGGYTRLRIDGTRVHGVQRPAGAPAEVPIERTIGRLGFFAGASDLVPLAVGMRPGRVIIAPVWSPNMATAENRIFRIVGTEQIDVEGIPVEAWRVEEHREQGGQHMATWWLLDHSPYMVYGEVPLASGDVQRMTEVEIPMTVATTTAEREVLAVVDRLFDAMRTRDTAQFHSIFAPGARLVGMRTRDGGPVVQALTWERFAEFVASDRRGPWIERAWQPEVRIRGTLATVWAAYDFHFGATPSHCGVDAIQLLRTSEGWRIFSLADTYEATGCPPRVPPH